MTLATVTCNFSGGCELLFGKRSSLSLENIVPQGASLKSLVVLLKDKYVTERSEQFVDASGSSLRPGVLALVNDVDVEVLGGMEYLVQDRDTIEFVSTLHGG